MEVAGDGLGARFPAVASVLPDALRQFTVLYPRTQVELRIEGNGALIEALDKGQLDLTLTIGLADRKGALLLGELPVLWIASRTFRMQDASHPLAVFRPSMRLPQGCAAQVIQDISNCGLGCGLANSPGRVCQDAALCGYR